MPISTFSQLIGDATTTANISSMLAYLGLPTLGPVFAVTVLIAGIGLVSALIFWIARGIWHLVRPGDSSVSGMYGSSEADYRRRMHGGHDPFGPEM